MQWRRVACLCVHVHCHSTGAKTCPSQLTLYVTARFEFIQSVHHQQSTYNPSSCMSPHPPRTNITNKLTLPSSQQQPLLHDAHGSRA
jgi:hypothetical protein